MSFDTLKVSELKKVAEDFGVELEEKANKNSIIAALAEEGVTWQVYEKTTKDIEDATEEIEVLPQYDKTKIEKDQVLVKMTRHNFRYDIMGYTFTKDHPFVPMKEEDAQEIFDMEDGFRLASPKEVQDFYS
jgi:hypothetical protein